MLPWNVILTNEETDMKKLNITKEQFNKSRYFTKKYGTLAYVSESGKVFKTDKGKVLMFKESIVDDDDDYARFVMSDLTDSIEKYLKSNKDDLDLESVEQVMDYNTALLLTFNTGHKIKISFDDELD